jgi:hypothetical protein
MLLNEGRYLFLWKRQIMYGKLTYKDIECARKIELKKCKNCQNSFFGFDGAVTCEQCKEIVKAERLARYREKYANGCGEIRNAKKREKRHIEATIKQRFKTLLIQRDEAA